MLRLETAILLTASLSLYGCIFGGGGGENDTTTPDAGNAGNPADAASDANGQSGDSGDIEPEPDAAVPEPDLANTDQGTADVSSPTDAGPAEPFSIVGDHELLTVGLATGSAVAQVAMFDEGFIAGYTARGGNTWIGWFEAGFPGFRSQELFDGNLLSFDVAGDVDNAYAAMVRKREVIVAHFTEASDTAGTWAVPNILDYSTGDANVDDYHETSIALEQSIPFIGVVQGTSVMLGAVSAGQLYAGRNQTEDINLEDPEIIGGMATSPGRRLFVAGTGASQYQLVDFETAGTTFSNTVFSCGPMPTERPARRVVPTFDRRVVAMSATANGLELSMVHCGATPARKAITLPSPTTPMPVDFDIAEETVPLGQTYGFAWSDDSGAHFGLLEVDANSGDAAIVDPIRIYDGTVESVRTAFNTLTGHYAVVVQNADEIRIFILERN